MIHIAAALIVTATTGMSLTATDTASKLGYVPAPPHITYVTSLPAGDENTTSDEADPATGTVYTNGNTGRFARGHETGHIFDAEILTPGDRNYFQRILQAPTGPWNRGTGATIEGLRSPSEWFADYYGAAAMHLDPTRELVSAYAPIGPVRLARFEAALGRVGRRHHLPQYVP